MPPNLVLAGEVFEVGKIIDRRLYGEPVDVVDGVDNSFPRSSRPVLSLFVSKDPSFSL